jgi:hypothetical protein
MNRKYILDNEKIILESLSRLNLILESDDDCSDAAAGKDGWGKCPKKRFETADRDDYDVLDCGGVYYIRDKKGLLDNIPIPDIPTTADGWKEIAKIAYDKLKKEGAKIGEKIKEVGGKFFEKVGEVISTVDLGGEGGSSTTSTTSTEPVQGPKYITTNASIDDIINKGIIVKKGMQGSVVSEIQQKLLDKGIKKVSEIGSASGIFDDFTEDAVEEFQEKYSLSKTGIVDAETMRILNMREYIINPSMETRHVNSKAGI